MAKKVNVMIFSVSGDLLDQKEITTRKLDKKKKNGKDVNEIKIGPVTYEIIKIGRPYLTDDDPANDLIMKMVGKEVA